MQITSPAFEQHQEIPKRYTCEGEDVSPPLVFHSSPRGVKSFAILVENHDAPRGTCDHWVAWNIPAESTGLSEGEQDLKEGTNSYGTRGWRGPCPPPGKPHHYSFRVFALDTTLNLPVGASKAELLSAMEGHILAQAELDGTFKR
jgi:Raf kinase inhibitor-like YbhB/YbcL family protein